MVKNYKRNLGSPVNNDCINQETTNMELHVGSECEREQSSNQLPTDGYSEDGYGRQYKFIAEDAEEPIEPDAPPEFKSQDRSGYHRYTATEVFSGESADGSCPSPYSRGVLGGGGGFNEIINDREEQLLNITGKPVVLLRRQLNGARCPCYSINRGRSRSKCEICFGTSFVPGYIPYVNQADPLGRIKVRFSPYTEDLPIKEIGRQQEVQINAWTLSYPIIKKRDVLIVFNNNGTEEFRYEVNTVTRNQVFGTDQGAQQFVIKRIDPTQIIYRYDPFKISDLTDIAVDMTEIEDEFGPIQSERVYENLGNEDEYGDFTNIKIENVFGDAAFSGMFTEGYKHGYQVNYKRILERKQPMWAPDFNEDGTVDDGYGPIFKSSNGQIIRFSTPQQTEDNIGVNPLEVISAEKKRHYLNGWTTGSKHGVLDAENELRARGLM